MKKLLSLLGAITLIGTSITSLVACNKSDNSGKKEGNKHKHLLPQNPQKDNNWKLDNDPNFINYKVDNKWYIAIFKNYTKKWYIVNFLNDSINDKILGKFSFYDVRTNLFLSDLRGYFKRGDVKTVYRWDHNSEPEIPKINLDTGEIIDWK